MGLDMFILRENPEDNPKEVFYWRKAYMVMDWFENRFGHVENLGKHHMEKNDFEALLEWCIRAEDDLKKSLEELRLITWTSARELSDDVGWHLMWIKHTREFLEGFVKDNDIWDDLYFMSIPRPSNGRGHCPWGWHPSLRMYLPRPI